MRFYTYLLLRSGTTERCVNISWINKGSKWADLMSFPHRSIPSSIKGAELCVSSLSLTTEHSYSEALGQSAWIDGGRITPLRWRQLHCINQSGAPLRSAIQTPRLKIRLSWVKRGWCVIIQRWKMRAGNSLSAEKRERKTVFKNLIRDEGTF